MLDWSKNGILIILQTSATILGGPLTDKWVVHFVFGPRLWPIISAA
jgi:hypothetical protein